MSKTKKRNAARESIAFLALVAAVLVVANVLGSYAFARVDLTRNQLFSLSDGSKRVARSLKDQMEIVAYFTEDLPPPFNATERYVRDLLTEYASASNGKIKVTVVHPESDEEIEAAEADGVQRVAHQVVENDSVSVREGYRGVALKYLGERKTLGVIEDTSGLEYRLTQSMKELLGDKTRIGLVSGHGSPTLDQGLGSLRSALPTFDIQEVNLETAVPEDLQALLIVEPSEAFTEEELRQVDAFVMRGGALGVFASGAKVDLQGVMGPTASDVDTGLNRLLEKWGVALREGIVGDWQCRRAPMRGAFGIPVAVPYPPVPVVAFPEAQREHPVLFRLSTVAMPFASPLRITSSWPKKGNAAQGSVVLARSSENSWVIDAAGASLAPKDPREWQVSGKTGPFPLAVARRGELPSAFAGAPMSDSTSEAAALSGPVKARTRLLVVGSGLMLRDELLPEARNAQGQQAASNALALVLNGIDWLTQDSDLIAVRAKTIEDPALEVPVAVEQAESAARAAQESGDNKKVAQELEKRAAALKAWEAKKAGYRWLNTLGVPVLFLLFGLWRWQSRKAVRHRAMAKTPRNKPSPAAAARA